MAADGKISAGFSGIYDKLVLLAGIVLLGVAAWVLSSTRSSDDEKAATFNRDLERLRPTHEGVPDVTDKIASYDLPLSRISKPLLMQDDKARKTGFFVPEARIFCINDICRYPIEPNWEKCPACGTEQVVKKVEDPTADSDGDGMPDIWERKFGFNPHDPSDAALDPDGDGFTNIQEYRDGTDPSDTRSHTELALLMHVGEIKATMLPLMFKGASRMPNGKYNCSFNYLNPARREIMTLYVKEGEQIANPSLKVDSGYKLDALEIAEEEYFDTVTNSRRKREVKTAVISSPTGKTFRLEMDKKVSDNDFIITIVQDFKDGGEITLRSEETFTVDGKKYKVVKVDKELNKVVIRDESDKREITLSREGAAR